MASKPRIMNKNSHKALLFAGATAGLNNHCTLASTPATEEFSHISPALITSSANKRGGVKKYIDTDSVGSVKNHNQRPAYLFGEVISDAKSGKTYIVILNFGNYEAGAN